MSRYTGYRVRVLDGNVLAGTDHRLTPLRRWLNACLPGKSVVVYQPGSGLVTDVVLCEDAYTQERALVTQLPAGEGATQGFVRRRPQLLHHAVRLRRSPRGGGFVLVRQHRQNLPCRPRGPLELVKCGATETGRMYEQIVRGHRSRPAERYSCGPSRSAVREDTRWREDNWALDQFARDGLGGCHRRDLSEAMDNRDPISVPHGALHCEVPGLGKPKAALFAFAMSLVASNSLAVVRASLRAAHGKEAEAEVSGYYLADEIADEYRSVMKYLPAEQWKGWRELGAKEMASLLTEIARQVNMAELHRNQRGPKKPPDRSRFTTENTNTSRLTASLSRLKIHVERLEVTAHPGGWPGWRKAGCSTRVETMRGR